MTLQSIPPAPLYKRIIAALIDFAVMWIILWVPIKLIFFGNIDNEIEFTRSGIGRYFVEMRLLALSLFPFCLRDMARGRGLGKWLAGIRVVDAADMTSAASFRQQVLRNLTIWVSPVGMASAYTHPDKMRFGDRLAGTAVVEVTHDPTRSVLMRRLGKAVVVAAVAACCASSAVFGFSTYVRNSPVHQVAVEFVTGYEPLREVAGDLSADNVTLMVARYGSMPEGAWAHLVLTQKTPPHVMQLEVLLTRPPGVPPQWTVKDASGLVTFRDGTKEKRRVFAFLFSRDFHRFLTDDEMKKIFDERQAPIGVIPELKEADNATTAPEPADARNPSAR